MIFESAIYKPSPNFTDKLIKPIGIIIHWTGGRLPGSLAWMLSKKSKVSAHFLISISGINYQLVDTNKKAWHAGKSQTKYGSGCNDYTIGIELEGPPSAIFEREWKMMQIYSAAKLCKELTGFHNIKFITDHSTVSPGRKIDVKKGTGIDLFPWKKFVKMTEIREL